MIFKREFTRNLKSLLIWSLVLSGLVLLTLSIYPQMAEQQANLDNFINAYPESLKKALGMDKINFGSLLGFYSIEVYMMVTLLGSIYAAMLASNMIAKEQNEKTVEFLLSKPVTRSRVISEKLLALVINIIILNVIVAAVSLLGFQFAKTPEYSMLIFLLLSAAALMLHLTFASISFWLSTFMRKSRTIISLSLGIIFAAYFLNIMSGITEDLAKLKYISFFSYVNAADIIDNQAWAISYVSIMLVVVILATSAAYAIYRKKDIIG